LKTIELDGLTIHDVTTGAAHRVDIKVGHGGISITPKGYGDYCSEEGHGAPVLVEVIGGKPRVVIWDDINKEDSSHVIPLDGAHEDLRIDQNERYWIDETPTKKPFGFATCSIVDEVKRGVVMYTTFDDAEDAIKMLIAKAGK
jgi:hypothetical protein